MKIVIDIPEEDYKKATDHLRIFNEKALREPFMNFTWRDRVEIALLHGTPLPKNHGRLIDADALDASILQAGFAYALTRRKLRYTAGDVRGKIANAPTIIEAESEGE